MISPVSPGYEAYDALYISGKKAPGVVIDVAGASRVNQWDIRKCMGISGATSVFTGAGLSKFSVTLGFWLPEHFALWDSFSPILRVRPKLGSYIPGMGISGKLSAVKIEHPVLLELGIQAANVEEELGFKTDNNGLWTKEIKFIEWRDIKMAIGRPEKSDSGPEEQDPRQRMIAERLATLQGLSQKTAKVRGGETQMVGQ